MDLGVFLIPIMDFVGSAGRSTRYVFISRQWAQCGFTAVRFPPVVTVKHFSVHPLPLPLQAVLVSLGGVTDHSCGHTGDSCCVHLTCVRVVLPFFLFLVLYDLMQTLHACRVGSRMHTPSDKDSQMREALVSISQEPPISKGRTIGSSELTDCK